jgi:hypothetical protein
MLDHTVFVITGLAYENHADDSEDSAVSLMVLAKAADETSAIQTSLEALGKEGFVRAEIDKIGIFDTMPDDPTMRLAYNDALSNTVAILIFRNPDQTL